MDHVYMRMSVAEDAQQLIDLDHRVWNSKNSPAPIHWQSLEQHQNLMPPGYQVVAIIDDKIVGYVSLRIPIPTPSNFHVWEIVIAVDPDMQGNGIGKSLMKYVKEIAPKNGVKKITLRVLATNTHAINFYKRMEFQEQGKFKHEFLIDGEYVDDYSMYLFL